MSTRARGRAHGAWSLPAAAALGALLVAGCHKQQTVNAAPPERTTQQSPQMAAPGPASGTGTSSSTGTTSSAGQGSGSMEVLKVRNALLTNRQLDARNIDVQYAGGMVHLSGTVPSASQKALAEKVARQAVAGKARVMDMLTVSKGGA